jgi:hypothetical protein
MKRVRMALRIEATYLRGWNVPVEIEVPDDVTGPVVFAALRDAAVEALRGANEWMLENGSGEAEPASFVVDNHFLLEDGETFEDLEMYFGVYDTPIPGE